MPQDTGPSMGGDASVACSASKEITFAEKMGLAHRSIKVEPRLQPLVVACLVQHREPSGFFRPLGWGRLGRAIYFAAAIRAARWASQGSSLTSVASVLSGSTRA